MRHGVSGKKLSRNSSQRKSLFKGLINELVIRGQIETSESKAKAIRNLVDKLITKGKAGTKHAQAIIGAFLQNKVAVEKIIKVWAPLLKNRPGGFTRIIRLGHRAGNRSPIVKLELVEKPKSVEKK